MGGKLQVFFYIDPDFVDDPSMQDVQDVTLSYTFFRTGDDQSGSVWESNDDQKDDKSDSKKIQEWTDEMRKHVHTDTAKEKQEQGDNNNNS